MKLILLVLFLAILCKSISAQLDFGNVFGKTLDQLGGAMQSVLNFGKKPSELAHKSADNAANTKAGITTTSTTAGVTTTTTSTTPVASSTTAAQSTTNGGTNGKPPRRSGGLGEFLLNGIGNAAQTMGKMAATAIGTVAQGPLSGLSNLSQAGASLPNLANSTIGAVTNGMTVLSQFVNATGSVVNMVQNQANFMNGIVGQFQNLSNNLFENFDRLMQQLQNITTALSPDLSAMAPFLPFIRDFINSTEFRVNEVLDEVNKRLISTVQNSVGTLLNQTNGLQVWAAQQRSRLDGSTKKSEGEKIIDEFVNESATKIQTCVNSTNYPIQQAYNYTREFVEESSILANHVVNQLQNCLGGQKLLIIRIFECIQNGTQTMSKGTDFIIHQILPIQSRIAAVSVRAALDWSCVATEVVSIGSSKPIIEQRINQLLRS